MSISGCGKLAGGLSAAGCGLMAGLTGTAAMTGWQYVSSALRDDDAGSDRRARADPWERAPAPAKVAKALLSRLGYQAPPESIGVLTNVMHWGYGTSWGVLFGLLHPRGRKGMLRRGVLFGTAVWAASYVMLVPTGFYDPPWEYPVQELGLDLSYHLVRRWRWRRLRAPVRS
jgi:predicted cobalt transporter CbtA